MIAILVIHEQVRGSHLVWGRHVAEGIGGRRVGWRPHGGRRIEDVLLLPDLRHLVLTHWNNEKADFWSKYVLYTQSTCSTYDGLRRTPGLRARNSQNTRKELATRGSESVTTRRDHSSQWGMRIHVGFFTETTSFLRNPGVRRSPSYAGRE